MIDDKINAVAELGPSRITIYSIRDIIAVMEKLTPEGRLDVMREFCVHCGGDDPRCRCWDDS